MLKATKPMTAARRKKKLGFLPEKFLSEVGKGRTLAAFDKGAIVFAQGEAANSIFYIQKGKVKLTVVSEQGKEAVIAMLGAADFFGEGCLTVQPLRMSTATAMADCSIMKLEKAVVIQVLHKEPAFAELLLSYMLTRTMRIEEDLVDQLFNSSEKRLARTLLLLARYGALDQPQKVLPKVSQEMLAEMIGTTRPRVNFFMNKFRKLGFIQYNGGLRVNNSLLSVVLHD